MYALQADNHITAPLYVTPDNDKVERFAGSLSPMPTVCAWVRPDD